MTQRTLKLYYEAFNAGDPDGMMALLVDDVIHEPSQGKVRRGKALFAEFLAHMNRCYREEARNPVFLLSSDGARGAAEFDLNGHYLVSDEGLPAATGQRYVLRVGTFFEFREGQISRVSNHYNLADWVAQVSTP